MGLYLPIDDNRCFAAQINGLILRKTKIASQKQRTRHEITERKGKILRNMVTQRLQEHATTNGWSHKNVRPLGMNGRWAVVVCPQFERVNERQTSWWIWLGLVDFLHGREDKLGECREDSQGFVVDQVKGDITLIPLGVQRNLWEQSEDLEGLQEPLGQKEWEITVDVS